MAGFWDNIREAVSKAAAAQQQPQALKSESSTTMPSGSTRNIERVPTLVDDKGHMRVWGFEQDKSRYNDVKDLNNPKIMDSFSWRDYTITPKNDETKSVNLSIAYGKDGRIAGVMKKDEGFDMGNGKVYPTVFGRENLKKFFSQFDRDATSYRVWQNEDYGDGRGEASIVFDSDEDDAPFVPSTIFKDQPIRIREYGPDQSYMTREPRVLRTSQPSSRFVQNWRNLRG